MKPENKTIPISGQFDAGVCDENVLTRADEIAPDDPVTTTFTYDDIGQLLTESRTGYSATYTYDDNGNRLTKSLGGTTHTYSYDEADKLLEITYGLLTVKEFEYDDAGRTTEMTESGTTTYFDYDYEDRVVEITKSGMTDNEYVYNGFGARVEKSDSGGTIEYLRSGTSVLGPVVSDDEATYTPWISERRNSNTLFISGDVKSITMQTDSAEEASASKVYSAFGDLTEMQGGTWNGHFAYGGKYGYLTDEDHSFVGLGHRLMSSGEGRFLTRDPAKSGSNWYSYAGSNPVNQADPTGLMTSASLLWPLIGPTEPNTVIIYGDRVGYFGRLQTARRVDHFIQSSGDSDPTVLIEPSLPVAMDEIAEATHLMILAHGEGGNISLNDLDELYEGNTGIGSYELQQLLHLRVAPLEHVYLHVCEGMLNDTYWLPMAKKLEGYYGDTNWNTKGKNKGGFTFPVPLQPDVAYGPFSQ